MPMRVEVKKLLKAKTCFISNYDRKRSEPILYNDNKGAYCQYLVVVQSGLSDDFSEKLDK